MLSQRLLRAVCTALAVGAACAGSAAALTSHAASGAAHLKLSHGVLSGQFTVPAAARVRHAHARVILTLHRHESVLTTVGVPVGSRARRPLAFRARLSSKLASGTYTVEVCFTRPAGRHTRTTCAKLGTIRYVKASAPTRPVTTTGTTTSPTTATTTPTATQTAPVPTPTASTTPAPTTTTPTTTPPGPPSPVWPVTTTATDYGGGCSYPKITSVPAPPAQAPTDPQNVTPNAVVNGAPAPFFADGLGQYQCASGSQFTSGFYVNVPDGYSAGTPETLVVQMHGCNASAKSDIYNLSANRHTFGPTDNPYIMISLQGPDGVGDAPACWSQPGDDFKVLRDIYLAETYFNINRHRIILLGYSSGGDLGYSTIFHYADEFAGILGQNTNPWSQNDLWISDRGSTDANEAATAPKAEGLAAWKFNVLQAATSGDTVYPFTESGADPGVQPVISAMAQDGFPARLIETTGTHGQDDVCNPSGGGDCTSQSDFAVCTPTSYTLCYGTYFDEVNYLLSTVAGDGWSSP